MDETLGAESGARPDTPVFLILLTDGKSQDDAVTAGNRLKATGVEIIGIGQRSRPVMSRPVMSHPVHIPVPSRGTTAGTIGMCCGNFFKRALRPGQMRLLNAKSRQ